MAQQARTPIEPLPGGPVRRVVVPVAGTDREFIAQEQAVLFADALGVPITAVKVSAAPDEEPPDLFGFVEKAAGRRSVDIDSVVLAGTDAVATFLTELDAMDLVIVGSERIGDRHHVGGFVERLLREAPGPVQIVRLGSFDQDATEKERAGAYQG